MENTDFIPKETKKPYEKPVIIKLDEAFALLAPFSRSWCYASSSK